MSGKGKAPGADCPQTDDAPAAGVGRRHPEEPAAREGESLLPAGSAAPTPDRAPERPSGTSAA